MDSSSASNGKSPWADAIGYDERLQLVEPRRRRVIAFETGFPLELSNEREESAFLVM